MYVPYFLLDHDLKAEYGQNKYNKEMLDKNVLSYVLIMST